MRVKSRVYRLQRSEDGDQSTCIREYGKSISVCTRTHTHTYTYTQASTATGYSTDVIAFSYSGDGAPIERGRSGDNPQTHARTFTRRPIGSLFFMAN